MQGAFLLGCPDIKHRPWLTQVQYISGRTRPSGETNGKSGNLNNACRQIYPAGCKIPDHEVICVMDADQVRRRRRHCVRAGPLRPPAIQSKSPVVRVSNMTEALCCWWHL